MAKKKMKRFIVFLIRMRLGLKKYQMFQFANQSVENKNDMYYFGKDCVYKIEKGKTRPSSVSLYWLLSDKCELIKYDVKSSGTGIPLAKKLY